MPRAGSYGRFSSETGCPLFQDLVGPWSPDGSKRTSPSWAVEPDAQRPDALLAVQAAGLKAHVAVADEERNRRQS